MLSCLHTHIQTHARTHTYTQTHTHTDIHKLTNRPISSFYRVLADYNKNIYKIQFKFNLYLFTFILIFNNFICQCF